MKIVCDNCATKYSIADEKVRGKVFKIRCKKCSHIIVVRGGDGAAAQPAAGAPPADAFAAGDGATQATPGAALPAAAPASDAVWHLVVDREQVGPLTPAEVRAKFAAGDVDPETYAWREGFADWLRLGSIEDFRDLAGAPAPHDDGATRRTDTADLFAQSSAPDEGGGGGDAADLFGAPAAQPAAAQPEPFGSPAANLFGAPDGEATATAQAAAPSARPQRTSSPGFAGGGGAAAGMGGAAAAAEPAQQRMTGQRNENSVLFSLNNLQALASGSGGGAAAAPKSGVDNRPGFANSQSEGSGLIDIRAMAASTLAASPATGGSSSRPEEPVNFSAAPIFSPMAAPILMPAAPSGPPKWMWPVIGIGLVAILGIVVVGVLLVTRKTEPVLASNVAAPGGPAAGPAGRAPAAPGSGVAPTDPGTATPPSAPAAASASDDRRSRHNRDKPAGPKADRASRTPRADAPPPPVAAAAPAPARSGGRRKDALDDLLDGASPESPKAARREAPPSEDSNLPEQLDKAQIVSGMQRIKPKVQSCNDQFHVPGTAMVAVTIGKSGRVSSASVQGSFAGTPTGSCVERAVKSASFSAFKGTPMSLSYPFVLR